MSDHRCLDWPELAALAGLPAGDPRRVAVDACPRCRNRLAEIVAFVRGTVDVPAAEAAAARTRLRAALARELDARAAQAPSPFAAEPRTIPLPVRRVVAWPRAVRLAAAAALVVAVAGALVVVRLRGPGTDTLRGEHTSSPMVVSGSPALSAPAPAGDGALRLTWSRVEEADRYRVRLLSETLVELKALETADTTLVLTRAALPPGVEPGMLLAWRVVALRGDAHVAESVTGTLRAP